LFWKLPNVPLNFVLYMIRYLSFYVPSRGTLVYVTLVLMVHPNDIVFSHYYPDSCRGPLPGVCLV